MGPFEGSFSDVVIPFQKAGAAQPSSPFWQLIQNLQEVFWTAVTPNPQLIEAMFLLSMPRHSQPALCVDLSWIEEEIGYGFFKTHLSRDQHYVLATYRNDDGHQAEFSLDVRGNGRDITLFHGSQNNGQELRLTRLADQAAYRIASFKVDGEDADEITLETVSSFLAGLVPAMNASARQKLTPPASFTAHLRLVT